MSEAIQEPVEQVIEEQSEQVEAQEQETQEIQEPSSEEPSGEVQAENEAELKEEVEAAIEDGATEEQVKEMVKEYHLKVNGKSFIKKVDKNDDNQIQAILQREAAGQMAMQEAAELKKAYEQELLRLKQNPYEVLEELGLDTLGLSEERIQAEIKRQQKSPEELEREQLQKEVAEARAKAEKLEKEAKEREENALYEQESAKLQEEINHALDAHTTLHASPRIVRRVAETMEWAMDNGFDNVSAEDVLPTVEAQMQKELNEMFSDFDEKAIERFIGKDNLEKMRKKRLEDVQKKPASIADLKKESSKPAPKKEEPKKRRRLDDFMRQR